MFVDDDHLYSLLTRLKLIGIRDRIDSLLDEASTQELSYRELLYHLCREEVKFKDARRISMGLSIAHFPCVRTFEGFDFNAQPSLDKQQIEGLRDCRWIANAKTLLFLGPPGVGKTHLSIALGRDAIEHGYTTLFTSAVTLLTNLMKAQSEGHLDERLSFYGKPKLLIIDELGYLPLETSAAHLFFQLVSKRYERGSILVTGNCNVGEWGGIFGDPVVATAILDRLLHHSIVITIRGESYRLLEKRRSGLIRSGAQEKES